MMNEEHERVRSWMFRTLQYNHVDYDDCGEVNCTKLAEDCADNLNLYEGDDCDIPEYIFDAAVLVGEDFINRIIPYED